MKSSKNYILMICILLLNACALNSQSDFSGNWILENAKSDAAFRDYKVTCDITQTPQKFTVVQTLFMKSGEKTAMPAASYDFDEKGEMNRVKDSTENLSAKWSPDKKTLTVKFVKTMDGNEAGSLTIYNFSDNGRVLTIKTSDLTGESPMIQVYNKK
jgi:hypothetical protein